MNRPRPTMTPEDVRSLREFFDSAAGKAMLGQIRAGYEVRPITDSRPEAFWRPSPPGSLPYPLDAEVSNEIPPDSSRTFRPAYAKQARRVSYWPLIIATMICTVACAGLLGWFVSAALKAHS